MIRDLIFILSLVVSTVTSAKDTNILDNDRTVGSFKMTCSDNQIHGYRHIFAPLQNAFTQDHEWVTNEKIGSSWSFVFDANTPMMYLDEKPVNYALVHAKTIILTEIDLGNGMGHSVWSYVLRPDHNSATGTQVNGFESPIMGGIKSRMVELKCITRPL